MTGCAAEEQTLAVSCRGLCLLRYFESIFVFSSLNPAGQQQLTSAYETAVPDPRPKILVQD